MLLGIDTDTVNHPALKMDDASDEGIGFAITKLTQGTYFEYDDAIPRARATRHRGMVPGFYHFLTLVRKKDGSGDEVPWNTGTRQCDWFIDHLPRDGAGEPDPEGYLIAVDFENNPNAQSFERDGEEWQPAPSGAYWPQLKGFVNRWFERFPDHPLFVYSSVGEWVKGARGKDAKALNRKLFCWNAYWASGDVTPERGRNWDDASIAAMAGSVPDPWKPGWGGFGKSIIWQAAGLGIKGYGKKVDGDVFPGTRAQLQAYATSGQDDPDPDPDPDDRPAYRQGYADLLATAATAIAALDPGAGGVIFQRGVADAKAAILGALPAPLDDPDA